MTCGDFHFCGDGLKDPESGLRGLKPTGLLHKIVSVKYEHQPLEGKAGTSGSRTKLAQVYFYQH